MPRGRKPILTEQNIREASEMYESGMTLQEIADEFKVVGPTIRKALMNAGVEIRSKGRRKGDKLISFSDSMLSDIRSMYEDGYSIGDIANLFGVSYPILRKALVEAGAEIRGRGRVKGSKVEKPQPIQIEEVLPQIAGHYAYLPLSDLNPMEKPERFEKLYESFFADHAAEDTIVYVDMDKSALIFTGLENPSKTRMKTWRAEWRKSEDREAVA